jgi:porphobilinogen synthase
VPHPGPADRSADPAALSGARVVVTRSADRARELVELLRGHGARVRLAPLLEATLPRDTGPVAALLGRAADPESAAGTWLVVTSVNTVRALRAVAGDPAGAALGERFAAARRAGLRVGAVGDATAAALTAAGLPPDLVPATVHSATGLLADWPPEPAPGTVLLPLSARARPTLEAGLTARGYLVLTATAYETVPWPAPAPLVRPAPGDAVDAPDDHVAELHRADLLAVLAAGEVDAVVLTAPSHLAELVGDDPALLADTVLVAIGEPTRRAAADRGLPSVAASLPTPEGIRDALARALAGPAARAAPGAPAPPAPHPTTAAPTVEGPPAPIPPAPIRTTAAPTTPIPTTEETNSVTHRTPRYDLVSRPRRLRTTPAVRRLAAQTRVHPSDLILPVFVRDGLAEPVPLGSMPGVVQHTMDSLRRAAAEAAAKGLGGFMVFGVPAERDPEGSAGCDPEGVLNRALRAVRAEVGDDLVVMADLCLDEFTDHGHCGVLADDGTVDNDATLEIYGRMAVAQAEAGAHVLGPSGMMDGQVGVIRSALDEAGRPDVAVLAYSAKYSSAFYGPFREAVDSQLQGDRRTYQMDPANRREALLELQLDLDEGADMVMVKPAMSYLDILRDVAEVSPVPVSAYQISGEYAMIEAAAANGWIDRRAAIQESVLSIRRAGADSVLTYFAVELADWFREENGLS